MLNKRQCFGDPHQLYLLNSPSSFSYIKVLRLQTDFHELPEFSSTLLSPSGDPVHQFDGYLDKESTERKMAHDIFNKGDTVFRSGDILIQDECGYFYFHDRSGDTFRWKGENVGTAEVESAISRILKMTDVVVYGVEIPGECIICFKIFFGLFGWISLFFQISDSREKWIVLSHQLPALWLPAPCDINRACLGKY